MRSILLILISLTNIYACIAQAFIHPGVNMTQADMQYMKQQVLRGNQPWKGAYDRLLSSVSHENENNAVTYVMQGPYNIPDFGGGKLLKDAEWAYNFALLWYITNDKKYADKAINILNNWSEKLRGFDYNNAKLLAGMTGYQFCNAAEILKYTASGWKQKEIDRFSKMLMTVYFPLIRFYSSESNGNWDGAMLYTLMSIAVFTDNRPLFDNTIGHFLHAPVNGSLFKYIYPNGQCQESTRDQAHVQMGIGFFVGAARIAYSQGVDLFSIANNRIALGHEYTAQFILGKTPPCYGIIAERDKRFNTRYDYEYVYRHYSEMGIPIPNIKQAADSVRNQSVTNILTAFRAPGTIKKALTTKLTLSPVDILVGADDNLKTSVPADAIKVSPGESIQDALTKAAAENKWVVATAGMHKLKESLKIPSGVTLVGEGVSTILYLDSILVRDVVVNGDDDLHDVTICNLVVDGATSPNTVVSPHNKKFADPNMFRSYRSGINRGGVIFRSMGDKPMRNIVFRNVTIRNCTNSGVEVSGAQQVDFESCNFDENGAKAVPGQKLQHNLLLTYSQAVRVQKCRVTTSPYGSGVVVSQCSDISVTNCEIARNGLYGLQIAESSNINASNNLIEGNDQSGIMVEFLYRGSDKIQLADNIIHYNAGYGIETYAAQMLTIKGNRYAGNGIDLNAKEKISNKVNFLVR